MKKALVLLLTAGALSSCSSVEEGSLRIVSEPPPKPELKIVRREPGSLWSEESRWNEIYTVPPAKGVGDALRVKVSDTLKARFAQMLGGKKTIGASLDEIPTEDKEPVDPKNPKVAKPAPKPPAPEFVDASITQVMPRGLFAIASRQTLSYGTTSARFELTGSVREKDINPDDTISSDNILNLKVEGQP